MKKGFTLIELLSVIIILGIILAIAIPNIMNVLNSSRIETYKNNIEKVMIKADEYISENINVLPKNIGETTEISLLELKNNNYIKDLKSPFNNNDCTGYILVTKTEFDYELIPHINCYENINSSTEDKLVLHYNFNEFQEPTINISTNDGQSGTSPIWGDGSPSLSVIDENLTFRGRKVARFITGSSGNFYINGSVKLSYATTSSNWTSTFYIKRVDNTPITNVGTYMYVSNNTNVNTTVTAELVEDGWYKVVRTRNNLTAGYVSLFGCYSLGASTEYYIADWMIEPKPHNTKYVSNSRLGTVYNLSINSNNSTLNLTTTPRWMSDNKNGVYLFNGLNTNISINNINPSIPYTVILWAKPNQLLINGATPPTGANRKTLIVGPGPVWNPGIWVTKDNIRIHCATKYKDYYINWDDLSWKMIGQTYDGNDCNIILDGEIPEADRVITYSPPTPATLLIGAETLTGGSVNWNGYIDDVKIYNRALSNDEIKLLYEITK